MSDLGLYVDDVILDITISLRSLPPLCNLLEHFSTISLYKLNHSNCQMLPIGLDPQIKNQIQCVALFSWAPPSSLQYLGIQLTTPSSRFFSVNFIALTTKLTQLSANLTLVPSSCPGCIALAKMFLLPHVL